MSEAPVDGAPETVSARGKEPENAAAVPSLDELAARLPDSTRRQLEELFRGRFIEVRRVAKEELY